MEALRRVTRCLLGTQDAHIKLRVQTEVAEQRPLGRGRIPVSIIFSRTESTSSGMAEYYAMCSTAEEATAFESTLEHFEFRVITTLFCGLGGSALDRSTFWIGKGQGFGSKDAMASKNCSRSWAADQGGILEGEQGGSGDESQPLARLNALRAACGSWLPERKRVNLSTMVEQMAEQFVVWRLSDLFS